MGQTSDIEIRSSDHFGARLRARRESYGLSLFDVSEMTNIKSSYLAAIEALDEAALPAIGYTIGYVRSYAKALGMDGAMACLLYTSPSPRDGLLSRMPSSA